MRLYASIWSAVGLAARARVHVIFPEYGQALVAEVEVEVEVDGTVDVEVDVAEDVGVGAEVDLVDVVVGETVDIEVDIEVEVDVDLTVDVEVTVAVEVVVTDVVGTLVEVADVEVGVAVGVDPDPSRWPRRRSERLSHQRAHGRSAARTESPPCDETATTPTRPSLRRCPSAPVAVSVDAAIPATTHTPRTARRLRGVAPDRPLRCLTMSPFSVVRRSVPAGRTPVDPVGRSATRRDWAIRVQIGSVSHVT